MNDIVIEDVTALQHIVLHVDSVNNKLDTLIQDSIIQIIKFHQFTLTGHFLKVMKFLRKQLYGFWPFMRNVNFYFCCIVQIILMNVVLINNIDPYLKIRQS